MHNSDRKFKRSYFGTRKGHESSASTILAWLFQESGGVLNDKENPSPFLILDLEKFSKIPHSFAIDQKKSDYPLYPPQTGDSHYHRLTREQTQLWIMSFEDSSALLLSKDRSKVLPIACQMKGGEDFKAMQSYHREELNDMLLKDAEAIWEAHALTKPLARTHEDKGRVEPPEGYEWSIYDVFSQNSLRITLPERNAHHLTPKRTKDIEISDETMSSLMGFAVDCISSEDLKEPFNISMHAPHFREEVGFAVEIQKKSGKKTIKLPKRISNLLFQLHPEITQLSGNSIWRTLPSRQFYGNNRSNNGLLLEVKFKSDMTSHDVMRHKANWRKNLDHKQAMLWNDVLDKIKN